MRREAAVNSGVERECPKRQHRKGSSTGSGARGRTIS